MFISVDQAAALLLSGEVAAIPTETVYGLAAIYNQPEAIKKIYALKKRPPKNPLIMHVERPENVLEFIMKAPFAFHALAETFWPGPLTLVLPALCEKIPEIVRSGLPTQGFRIPSHPLALELIKKTGPLVAPSANLSGFPSASSAFHVEEDFGKEFPVLNGGLCARGVESTILIYTDSKWMLGRLGAIPSEAFEPILGYIPAECGQDEPLICPGQAFRHYAPKAKIHLATTFEKASCIIGFSDRAYPPDSNVIRWGDSSNPQEVLMGLYEMLRRVDRENIKEVWVDINFKTEGLWKTLLERLQKASTK